MHLEDAIREVQQPRSRYQIERFVLGQHDTPEMRFYQLCLEAQQVLFSLRRAELEERKARVQIARLRDSPDEVDHIEADLQELGLEQTRLAVRGARRELQVLQDLFDSMPHFTREQIEQAQPDYWRARLTRQAELQALSSGVVGWAHLDALRQAGALDDVLAAARPPAQLTG